MNLKPVLFLHLDSFNDFSDISLDRCLRALKKERMTSVQATAGFCLKNLLKSNFYIKNKSAFQLKIILEEKNNKDITKNIKQLLKLKPSWLIFPSNYNKKTEDKINKILLKEKTLIAKPYDEFLKSKNNNYDGLIVSYLKNQKKMNQKFYKAISKLTYIKQITEPLSIEELREISLNWDNSKESVFDHLAVGLDFIYSSFLVGIGPTKRKMESSVWAP